MRKVIIALLALMLTSAVPMSAMAATTGRLTGSVRYAPAQPTLVNGKPQLPKGLAPRGWFDWEKRNLRYSATTAYRVQYFKLIASTSAYNPMSSPAALTLNIQQSSTSGSEFYGNLEFGGEVKIAVIGGIQGKVGFGLKEIRSKNEAVGATNTLQVDPGHTGTLEAYWGGESASGTLYYDMYYGGTYQSSHADPVGAIVHTESFDVNFKASKS